MASGSGESGGVHAKALERPARRTNGSSSRFMGAWYSTPGSSRVGLQPIHRERRQRLHPELEAVFIHEEPRAVVGRRVLEGGAAGPEADADEDAVDELLEEGEIVRPADLVHHADD